MSQNPPSQCQQPQSTPKMVVQLPIPPKSVPSAPLSPPQPEAGDSKWSKWPKSDATQQREEDYYEDTTYSKEDSTHPAVADDNGGKRGAKHLALRDCDEAMEASGRELDEENATWAKGQAKRKRKRGQKFDVRRGRGMAKPRKPTTSDCRP